VPHGTDQTDHSQREAEIQLVIRELEKRTSQTITREWAIRVREQLLGKPGIRVPLAYMASVIQSDPQPRRFLPGDGPPRFTARNGFSEPGETA
jgi:hypothetical protein